VGTYGAHVTELLNLGSVPAGSDAETMIKAALNNAYRQVLGASGQEMRHREFSLTTVADQAQYGLDMEIKAILNIEDAANRRQIPAMTKGEFDARFAGRTETNDPTQYYQVGIFGAEKAPAAAGALTVESSLAADATNMYVTLVYRDSNDTLTREKLTLNGTTPVSTSGSATTKAPESIVKTADSGFSITGNIIVKDGSANVISRIPQWVDSPAYIWVEFDWIPSTARTYTIRSRAVKPALVYDEDWPEFDENFHTLLTYIAGSQVLPVFGKQAVADRFHAYAFNKGALMDQYLAEGDPEPDLVFRFDNVTNAVSDRLPKRQPIIGIDFGLVS